MMKKIIFCLLLCVLFVGFNGKILDLEAERVIHNLYTRDKEGIINGLQSTALVRGDKNALVLIHGFFESSDTYSMLVDDIKDKVNVDIYAPTMPFQARDLETGAKLNSSLTVKKIKQFLDGLSKKYQSVTVVGFSFGGAILTDLAEKNELPDNVNLVLYAPAVYIKENTLTNRLKARLYGLWRNYCNYAFLGCKFPSYDSGDSTARFLLDKEKTLQYKIVPALLEMYKLDLNIRNGFSHIARPYSLIVAIDDNRVSYERQKQDCYLNTQYCHLYSFSSGKHIIHWGANKNSFEALLIKLLNSTAGPTSRSKFQKNI